MAGFRRLKYPPSVFWELTELCNHNCVHCFNYWRSGVEKTECVPVRSKEEYLELAKKILEHKPAKVVLTGGEPLLAFENIKAALLLMKSVGVYLSFNTNAALLDEPIAEFFAENDIGMFISFPSDKKKEFDFIVDRDGAYEKVLAALEIAKRHRLSMSFNMVVSKANLDSVFSTASFLKERFNAKHISITRVSVPINARDKFGELMLSKDDFEKYLAQCVKVRDELCMTVTAASPITPCSVSTKDAFDLFAFKGGCEAGKTSYALSAEGNMRACARDSKEYGNIISGDFDLIWASMDEWRDDSFIPEECSSCAVRSRCRGGCRVDGVVKCDARNALDSFSDISRLPIEFSSREEYLPSWDYTTVFSVPRDIILAEEEFAFRISRGGSFEYCTPRYADFLKKTPRFTLSDFCENFSLDMKKAIAILNVLYKKRIILTENCI